MTKAILSLQAHLNQIAIYQTAFAILAGEIDVGSSGEEKAVTIVPGAKACADISSDAFNPMVTMSLDSEPSELEDAITVQLSGLAASLLMQNQAEGIADMTLSQAHTLAERLADMMVPDWRTSQSQLVSDIKKRCYERAAELVTTHKERIAKVTELLARNATASEVLDAS